MPEAEPWTVGRLLQWTADFLKRHGSESPRLDAEVLLAEVLGCARIELYTAFESVPNEAARTAFRELVRRRSEGAPVAYLVGRREFYSLTFHVTPDVLIPRPETEFLVIALVDLAKARSALRPGETIAVCDVGTGSGNIAVSAAKYIENCRVTATDISRAALEVARSNAESHGVLERIELVESDLFAGVPGERRFEFIVSNPPYVSEAEINDLAPDVRNFEPRRSLVAGSKGTEVIESLVPQAAERLTEGGSLLMEIGPTIHGAVLEILGADSRLEIGPTVNDLARLPRVVQAKRRTSP